MSSEPVVTEPPALRIELRPLESANGQAAVAEVLAQLPDPDGLAPGTKVIVLDAPKGGGLSRLFRRATSVKTVFRASALLARGYVEIEEGKDEAGAGVLVWGRAPGITSISRPSPDR